MSHPVTVDLSEEAYVEIQMRARAIDKSPEEVAAAALEQQFGGGSGKGELTQSEKRAAREQLRRHFGAVDLGHPTGVDNEGIDADLVREYGNNHEGS